MVTMEATPNKKGLSPKRFIWEVPAHMIPPPFKTQAWETLVLEPGAEGKETPN